jgi:hypothetical protein
VLPAAGCLKPVNNVSAVPAFAWPTLPSRLPELFVPFGGRQQHAPFVLVVMSPAVISLVAVPVTSRPAVMVVAPTASRVTVIGSRVMPFPFTSMALFPLPALPIAMSIVVPVAIPARTNDHSGRRLDIHRRRRSIYRLGRIHGARDANVYSDIDVCESDGRCAYAKASNQCHREPATA